MSNDLLSQVSALIQSAQRFLVVTHLRPDGDAIGALLGLGLALLEAGKQVQMVSVDGVPGDLRHLTGSDQVRTQPEGEFDFIIAVDCSELRRTGGSLDRYLPPDLNIDHHITNTNFARYNVVETEAVATSEILATWIPGLNLPLTQPVASALLTGIITDTIGFRTSNMTPQALRLAADLMERGSNLPELYQKAFGQQSFESARYWAGGLGRLERWGKLVWTTLTLTDRRVVGYPGRDDADLINVLSAMRDVDIAMIFVEQTERQVKVSWRAKPGFNVAKIAVQFGGGGHAAAAGAEIEGNLAEICAAVIKATKFLVEGNSVADVVRF